ncbi:hypothetical protein J7L48_10220, partial [bacterium]|nr:hypothetical protein [bacterium]
MKRILFFALIIFTFFQIKAVSEDILIIPEYVLSKYEYVPYERFPKILWDEWEVSSFFPRESFSKKYFVKVNNSILLEKYFGVQIIKFKKKELAEYTIKNYEYLSETYMYPPLKGTVSGKKIGDICYRQVSDMGGDLDNMKPGPNESLMEEKYRMGNVVAGRQFCVIKGTYLFNFWNSLNYIKKNGV